MSVLCWVVYAGACRGTHHKLAVDALRHLQIPTAESWRNLFLSHYEWYLRGAKAPDDVFKDFRNHVLHVDDKFWGGAVETAGSWFQRTVDALANGLWREAAYSAGVLSHYVTDPFQPLHTAQSEEEGAMHRACEWSISICYDELSALLEQSLGGYPTVHRPPGEDWLGDLIRRGARAARGDYEVYIQHYNLAVGKRRPAAGLDDELRIRVARQIGAAVKTMALVLEQAIEQAKVMPPDEPVVLETIVATMKTPLYFIERQLINLRERFVIDAMYDEFQVRGKCVATLPEDERTVRRLYADEVLDISVLELDAKPAKPIGSEHGQSAGAAKPKQPAEKPAPAEKQPPLVKSLPNERSAVPEKPAPAPAPEARRVDPPVANPPPPRQAAPSGPLSEPVGKWLETSSPVEAAPSIGPKTADRLSRIDVRTVDDLLQLEPAEAAKRLNIHWIDAARLRAWQQQAELACRVSGLRGIDTQLLVAAGVATVEQLQGAEASRLMQQLQPIICSAEGERILRSSRPPEQADVERWIRNARQARTLAGRTA